MWLSMSLCVLQCLASTIYNIYHVVFVLLFYRQLDSLLSNFGLPYICFSYSKSPAARFDLDSHWISSYLLHINLYIITMYWTSRIIRTMLRSYFLLLLKLLSSTNMVVIKLWILSSDIILSIIYQFVPSKSKS